MFALMLPFYTYKGYMTIYRIVLIYYISFVTVYIYTYIMYIYIVQNNKDLTFVFVTKNEKYEI